MQTVKVWVTHNPAGKYPCTRAQEVLRLGMYSHIVAPGLQQWEVPEHSWGGDKHDEGI